MEFSVNTKALVGLVDMLDRRGTDIGRVARYVNAHSALQWGPGLLNNFRGTHEQVGREVYAFLQRVANNYLYQYAVGIDGAIYDYNGSDQAANTRFDGTLPGSNGLAPRLARPADQALGPDIFADPGKLVLKEPPDFSGEYPYEPHWYDTFSPSSWGRIGLWKITSAATTLGVMDHPIDPAQAFTLPLCGDWPGLERYAYALRETGRALGYVSERVTSGATTLSRVWTGHAADNCATALGSFALDLADAQEIFNRLADGYHEIAKAAAEKGEALAHLVTVVGDIVGSFGMAAIFKAPEVIAKAPELVRVIAHILDGIEGLHMTIEGGVSLGKFRANDLSQMLSGSVNAKTSAGMPVLPTPAHRR
jgi:uncharacterized protein YukE